MTSFRNAKNFSFRVELAEANLCEVQNDIRHVLENIGERAELMQNTFKFYGRNRRTHHRAQKHATKRVTQGNAKTALQRTHMEFAVTRSQSLFFDLKTLRFNEFAPEFVIVRLHCQLSHSLSIQKNIKKFKSKNTNKQKAACKI